MTRGASRRSQSPPSTSPGCVKVASWATISPDTAPSAAPTPGTIRREPTLISPGTKDKMRTKGCEPPTSTTDSPVTVRRGAGTSNVATASVRNSSAAACASRADRGVAVAFNTYRAPSLATSKKLRSSFPPSSRRLAMLTPKSVSAIRLAVSRSTSEQAKHEARQRERHDVVESVECGDSWVAQRESVVQSVRTRPVDQPDDRAEQGT